MPAPGESISPFEGQWSRAGRRIIIGIMSSAMEAAMYTNGTRIGERWPYGVQSRLIQDMAEALLHRPALAAFYIDMYAVGT